MGKNDKGFLITGSIVLFNNEAEIVQKAIDSFFKCGFRRILFLIDNSPTDSLSSLAIHKDLRYFHNPSNPGFGAGHNIALRKVVELESDYHLILNPDVFFDSGVIESLVGAMRSDDNIGLVMPKVLYPNGSVQFTCKLLPTPLDLFVRRFIPFEMLKNRMDYRYELKFSGYDKIMNIPFLSGCFMFFKTEVLNELDGFDEDFFMYYEDLDLTRRVHKKYRTIFYPHTFIYHSFARASYKNRKLLKVHINSVFTYFNKWGWIFDSERARINRKVIEEIKSLK